MNPEHLIELINTLNESALLADGLDQALVGYTEGMRCLAVYDTSKVLDILMTRDGMTYEEAEGYFDYNISGAYVGEYTPVFVTFPKEE